MSTASVQKPNNGGLNATQNSITKLPPKTKQKKQYPPAYVEAISSAHKGTDLNIHKRRYKSAPTNGDSFLLRPARSGINTECGGGGTKIRARAFVMRAFRHPVIAARPGARQAVAPSQCRDISRSRTDHSNDSASGDKFAGARSRKYSSVMQTHSGGEGGGAYERTTSRLTAAPPLT